MIKNLKRTFKYVKGRYHFVVISLIMIIIVQILNFFSPLIVKEVLDNYIMGIEFDWVEISEESEKSVLFNDRIYKQVRFLDDEDIVLNPASIIINKSSMYFINDEVVAGTREFNDNSLLVTSNDGLVYTYDIVKLSAKDLTNFYNPVIPMLVILIIIIFVRMVLVITATYFQHISSNRVASYIAKDARTAAMKSVERLPIKYFEAEPAGKMASRINYDVDGMISLFRMSVNIVLPTVLSFVFAYIGMFYLDYRLALISFVIYPIVYIWIRYFLKHLKVLAEKVNELRSLLTAKINEIINGISILQIFNFKKHTVKEFNVLNDSFRTEQLKEVKLNITAGWNMVGLFRGFVTVLIVAYFGWQHLSFGEIAVTAGLVYAYNEYLLKIIDPVQIIFQNVCEYQHSMVRVERISKLIEGELEDDTTGEIDRYVGAVKFDNIWFAYDKDNYVLKGVDIDIKPGEMIGLVGHTGSGKSTLMNLLLRFYDIEDEKSGNIYVDGMEIKSIPKRVYRNHLGVVLQEPTLFKGTIASNIRFGRDDVSDEEVEKILISVGGENILKKFDDGIHHPITRTGVNLSSGEKQIITLARVIIHNPSILIMDEATSHIDTETEAMIKKALEVVSKGRTVIVVAHRLSTIYNADRIIVLDHGIKVEEGKHQELVQKNGYYANMYRAQLANIRK